MTAIDWAIIVWACWFAVLLLFFFGPRLADFLADAVKENVVAWRELWARIRG